jgi:hypothetical protein
MRWRTTWVAVLAALLMVSGTGAALAADEADTVDGAVLDAVKERVLEKITKRIERLEAVIENLEGEDGIVAEQKVALAREGIVIFEAAAAEVEEAETIREALGAYRDAVREFKAHKKVRKLYTHVHLDLGKFNRRLDRLDTAIERAEEAGVDVGEAVAESEAASEDLALSADLLGEVDPSETGSGVMGDLREAHGAAHDGQRHIRAGWKALRDALPPE